MPCFFFYPVAVAGDSNTVLNRSGESGHPCVVPDLKENAFSLFPLSMTLAAGSSCMTLIMLRRVPSSPALSSDFLINGCWI